MTSLRNPLSHNFLFPVSCPQTIRRKRKVQIPVSRPGDRETMSEHEEEEDSEEDDGYDERSGRGGYGGASGGTGRRGEQRSSSGKRDRSASRERSASPRSDRRSQMSSVPPRPAKVTLVKSRKNEGGQHNVGGRGTAKTRLNSIYVDLDRKSVV